MRCKRSPLGRRHTPRRAGPTYIPLILEQCARLAALVEELLEAPSAEEG